MVYEELSARLNEAGYKNWLKVWEAMQEQLQTKGESVCSLCEEWKSEILRHYTSRDAVVNWGNCKPWLWPSQHWEVAKAYMPRGQTNITRPDQCDTAALLNLINFCDHFGFVDQNKVREVIRQRNDLMHSCEMRVSAQWMAQFHQSLNDLLQQFRHVPEVAAASQEIQEILFVDWSVHIPGSDDVDGPRWEGMEPGLAGQVEVELLRERLRDLMADTETEAPPDPKDLEQLQTLHEFIRGQKDLEQTFHTELHSLHLQQTAGNEAEG